MNLKKSCFFVVIIFFTIFLNSYSQTWIDYYKKTKECIKSGEYTVGIDYAEKSLSEAEKLFGKNDTIYAECLSDLASLYRYTGKYDKAETLFLSALKIRKEKSGENSENYAYTLNNLSLLYKETARYFEAEESYLKVKSIFEKIYSENSPFIAVVLNNLGTLYMEMGQYLKSEPLFIKALDIYKETIGEEHLYYMNALHNFAALYVRMGLYDRAEPMYRKSLALKEKIYGKKHPDYALTLNDLGDIYVKRNEFEKAEKIYKEAVDLVSKNQGEQTSSYALVLNGLARTYSLKGKYDVAENMFKKVIEIDRKIYGENHPDYITDLANLAEMYNFSNDYLKADEIYKQVNSKTLSYVNSCYEYLSEREKILLMITLYGRFNQYFSFASKYVNKYSELAGEMLNIRMSTKRIAINSTINIKNEILNSGDSLLIREYQKLMALRDVISKVYTMDNDERVKMNLNLDSLKEEANSIEKTVTIKSKFYKETEGQKNFGWKEIKNELKDDEAAVEFLDFDYFGKEQTDTTIYCALLLLKNNKLPVYVKLCNGSELDEVLKKSGKDNYSKSDITSNKLYKLLWQPIETYLTNVQTVYVSTSGLTNKISLSGVASKENEYLCDKYTIRYFGNILDVTRKDDAESKNNFSGKTATVFGGAVFDLDSVTAFQISKKYSRGDEWTPPTNIAYNEVPKLTVSKWNYLAGTLNESEDIKSLLEKSDVKVNLFTGADASKEAFKLSVSKISPYVIHIASHGFFYPSLSDYTKKGIDISKSGGNKFQLSPNALIRSGIILSGANRVWLGGNEIEGIDNGILTAMEISNMNLLNTELVVLSACETGLGDIYSEEGVFGLQRAFKVAGAKTIIMSLWKVSDKETVELMKLFYTNWLGGMTKHDAFTNAQKEMRKKYSPYYWAAFVMVE
jgi:CHAT domain-containing protein/Tfp pilus assembly protein PilF